MLKDTGHYATPNASRYLVQLCKHFAHKVDVSHDANHGTVALGTGPATLHADATTLKVDVTAPDPDELAEARDVIDRHLVRFAHREGFTSMTWDSDHS